MRCQVPDVLSVVSVIGDEIAFGTGRQDNERVLIDTFGQECDLPVGK